MHEYVKTNINRDMGDGNSGAKVSKIHTIGGSAICDISLLGGVKFGPKIDIFFEWPKSETCVARPLRPLLLCSIHCKFVVEVYDKPPSGVG